MQNSFQGTSWWRSGWEPTHGAEDIGLIPGPRGFRILQSTWAHVPQLPNPGSSAHEPQLLSLCSAATEAHAP